jgi:hypothetical protein
MNTLPWIDEEMIIIDDAIVLLMLVELWFYDDIVLMLWNAIDAYEMIGGLY